MTVDRDWRAPAVTVDHRPSDAELDAMIRRRNRFQALLAADTKRRTKARLAELWAQSAEEVYS